MKIKTMALVAALALADFTADAWAKNSLGMKFLGNVPTSEVEAVGSDKDGGTGLGIGAEWLYRLNENFAYGAEILNLGRSSQDSTVLLPGAMTTVSGNTLAFMASFRLYPLPGKAVEPYLGAAFGFGQSHLEASATPNPGFRWVATNTSDTRQLVDSTKTAPVFGIRGGATTKVGESFSLGFEIGWYRAGKVTHGLTTQGQQVLGNQVVDNAQAGVAFGLTAAYLFGK